MVAALGDSVRIGVDQVVSDIVGRPHPCHLRVADAVGARSQSRATTEGNGAHRLYKGQNRSDPRQHLGERIVGDAQRVGVVSSEPASVSKGAPQGAEEVPEGGEGSVGGDF